MLHFILLRKKVFLFIVGFVANSAMGQTDKLGNWFIYFGNQPINKKINWHNEVQYRNYNLIGNTNQVLLRTGIGYNLTANNNNVLIGYAFIESHPYLPNSNEKKVVNEHRIFQQYIYRHSVGNIFLQHRARVEERFFENDYATRLRYFLSANIPLNSTSIKSNTIYLSAYNEIFLNAASTMFDRDRVYAAIGFAFNKNLRTELGFMSQIQSASTSNQLQIVLFNNIPFLQKQAN